MFSSATLSLFEPSCENSDYVISDSFNAQFVDERLAIDTVESLRHVQRIFAELYLPVELFHLCKHHECENITSAAAFCY